MAYLRIRHSAQIGESPHIAGYSWVLQAVYPKAEGMARGGTGNREYNTFYAILSGVAASIQTVQHAIRGVPIARSAASVRGPEYLQYQSGH